MSSRQAVLNTTLLVGSHAASEAPPHETDFVYQKEANTDGVTYNALSSACANGERAGQAALS